MAVEVTRSSIVPAPPSVVWDAVSNLHGVNQELRPFVVMREPAELRGRTLGSIRPGERHQCLMLAGGIIPFDRHHLNLESVDEGVGFVEESTSWMQRRWRHERTLEAVGEGTRVTDKITAEPRVPLLAPLVKVIVAKLFDHRHRRLAGRFAAAPRTVTAAPPPTDQVGGGTGSLLVEKDLSFVGRSPRQAEASVDVDATPAQVWAVLVDHRRWPEWFGPSLVACEPTSTAEAGVGSSRVVKLRGGATIAEQFIAWNEPELWAFTGTAAKPKVFRSLVEQVRISPLERGRCRVTYTMAFEPAGLLGRVGPLLERGISKTLDGAVRGLGRRAESLAHQL